MKVTVNCNVMSASDELNTSNASNATLKRGYQRVQLFLHPKRVPMIMSFIEALYTSCYDEQQNCIDNGIALYNPTDFLLGIYYVLVAKGEAVSVVENKLVKEYLRFLNEDCQLKQVATDRVFHRRINKVKVTRRDFHQLNQRLVNNYKHRGGFTPKEYETMVQITGYIAYVWDHAFTQFFNRELNESISFN